LAEAPHVDALVPHRGPARLLETVVNWRAGALAGRGRIPADSPFARDGRAPCFMGLELAAQGAAALQALSRPGDPAPRVGYLVGVREARFLQDDLPVETALTFVVQEAGHAGALGVYEATIALDGVECVSATFSTYSKP
jgi:predicted hotdog family 3-hydroxylacyl-ACP dehydratase